jgi:hypothetical protein
MVAPLVSCSFGSLARWLLVCLLQQALLKKALPSSGDGRAMTAARLQLALVSIVFARWYKDLFVILLILGPFVLLLMIINRSEEFLKNVFCDFQV